MHKKCALCLDTLTSANLTKEHIIPNSIGGRRKTKGFICNKCNNECGNKWESVLANQFLWFSLATNIKREHGNPRNLPIKTIEGEEFLLRHDGTMTPAKPCYKAQEDENGKIKIQIQARTKDEARDIVKGVARKYPSVDAKVATENLLIQQNYLGSPLAMTLEFGGPDGGRSMVKTALALASEYGIDHYECEKAINYLKNEKVLPPFGFCYTFDLIENRPQQDIFHCVAIRGLPEHGKLLAYVEFFNLARIIVELSDRYAGKDIYYSYAINPTTGLELDIQVNFDIGKEEMQAIIDGDGMPQDKYIEAVNYVLPIVLRRNFDREINRLVTEAAQFAFERLEVAPNECLPPEKHTEFLDIMMERIKPFILTYTGVRSRA